MKDYEETINYQKATQKNIFDKRVLTGIVY